MRAIVLALLPLLLLGCGNKEVEEPTPSVGKYVYKDSYKIVHIDRECNRIHKRVERIQVSELRGKIYYCPKCVSDEAYEYLISLDTIQ